MIKDLDLKDRTQERLAGFAARIATLLERPDVQKNEPLVSVLDDLLGAVYALIAARQENFKGKIGKSDFAPILDRAKRIAATRPKVAGNWMAGFHFNSAMFRISAVFDRLPKSLAGCKHGEACCEHGAAARYQKTKGKAWQKQQLNDIRKEVNAIKHEAIGVYRDPDGVGLALVTWRAEYDASEYELARPRVRGSGIVIRPDLFDRLANNAGERRLVLRDFVVGVAELAAKPS